MRIFQLHKQILFSTNEPIFIRPKEKQQKKTHKLCLLLLSSKRKPVRFIFLKFLIIEKREKKRLFISK